MLNILFISHDSVPYGAPKSMLNIINGLKSDINFTILIPYKGSIQGELDEKGFNYYISRYHWDVYDLNSVKDYFLFPYRLLRLFVCFFNTIFLIIKLHKHIQFDAIHSNSGVIRVGFFAAKFLRIPHIWHIREFQTKDYNLNILFGTSYLKKIFRKSDITICVSESVKKHFELTNGIVIYNGVASISDSEILFDKEDYFIFAGSLLPEKGIYELLKAFVEFSKINLTINLMICGTGNKENINRIERVINQAGLKDRIYLLGYRNDVTELLKKAKACIVASHYEAFGRITAEAMFVGCPVIGKASEGTLEIIKDESFGLLFNTEDELKNAMIYITDTANKEKISMMINFSKRKANLLFTQEELCKNILNIYDNLKK